MTLFSNVGQTVEKFGMLRAGDGVVVTVSGGPDSVALLSVMRGLSRPWNLTLAGAYLNHGLRGAESEAEERFVDGLFERAGVPLHKCRMEPADGSRARRGNLEERCREERYRFFDALRAELGFRKIALGHNRDDLAETVIMHFLRGSGPEGLQGMLPVRDGVYIRPLIEVSREDILLFLRQENLDFVTDSTNDSETYLRNRIRKSLIPELTRGYNPRLAEHMARMADIIREENDYMNGVAESLISSRGVGEGDAEVRLAITEMRNLHPALQRRVLIHLLHRLARAPRGIGYSHLDSILTLLTRGQTGGSLDLPMDLRISREYGELLIRRSPWDETGRRREKVSGSPRTPISGPGDYSYEATIPGSLPLGHLGTTLVFDFVDRSRLSFARGNRAFLDFEAIVGPLVVRNVRPGDRIQPLGMKGRKKVKALFIDGKIPRAVRRSLPVLADGEEVLWIPGVRLSEKVRIRDETTRVLKVEMI